MKISSPPERVFLLSERLQPRNRCLEVVLDAFPGTEIVTDDELELCRHPELLDKLCAGVPTGKTRRGRQ